MGMVSVLPGLVRFDLVVGGGLDGDGGDEVGVVSCEMEKWNTNIYIKNQCVNVGNHHLPKIVYLAFMEMNVVQMTFLYLI